MDRTQLAWTGVVLFGSLLIFDGLRRLTEDQGTAVTVPAQVGALAVILAAVVLFVRRRS